MKNDPFGQFSNVFANEFAKQCGAAAINAWQEALTTSFGSRGPNQAGSENVFKNWFGTTAEENTGTNSPVGFLQQFLRQFPGAGASDLGAGANYLQFAEYIEKYLDMFSANVDPTEIAEQMSSTFQQSLDQLSSLSASPWMSFFEQFGQAGDSAALLKSITESFHSLPFHHGFSLSDFLSPLGDFNVDDIGQMRGGAAIGPAREWQIAVQDVMSAAERYRHAQTRMHQHTAATFDGASKQFWQELGHGEGELTSIREVYDFWVNCAEDAYAKIVMTDDYSRDFGESINSQANLKLKFGALLNRFFEMLNIPNRREMDGVIQNLSRLEVRLEELENRFAPTSEMDISADAAAISDLKKEIESLSEELRTRDTSSDKHADSQPKKRKKKRQTSKLNKKAPADGKPSKNKSGAKTTKLKAKNSKATEFEIAKITNSN